MQMRSCAVWGLCVVGLFAFANPAWAAPKKKHKRKHHAATAAAAEPAPASSDEPKDIDELMSDSTKKKTAAPVQEDQQTQSAEPDDKPLYDDEGSPDAWERPPVEEEKPKKKVHKIEHAKVGDGHNINIGIVAGYGVPLGTGLTALNPYGLGAGLQGDYELDNHLVIGVGGEFFLGETDNNATNNLGVRSPSFARYVLGHALVGYNIWLSNKLILRPSLWVGVAIAMVPKSAAHQSGLAITALLGPGLSLHYILSPTGWYTGADVHISAPVGQANSTQTGMPILLTFGKRF